MYGIYANKTGVFVDGKCDTINMAYIRIRHGIGEKSWIRVNPNHVKILKFHQDLIPTTVTISLNKSTI